MKPKIRKGTLPDVERYFWELPEEMREIGMIREAIAKNEWRGHQVSELPEEQKTLIRQWRHQFCSRT